jgi:hypothetical protein
MLVQWLNGEVGGEEERGLARSVGRLVIAGNLTRVPSAAETTTTNGQSKEPMGKLVRRTSSRATGTRPPSYVETADQ